MSDFSVDFTKSYARRRPEEPRSHYSQRLKFINTLIKGEGDKITDDRIEVLSHCYSNVKYLANVYNEEIMGMLRKYVASIADALRLRCPFPERCKLD
ncbi:unnamed protein product [Symbiodinium sp. CCMP2456]|nr:unnamed protein product [Symbiodinium sp. CCMP2456]